VLVVVVVVVVVVVEVVAATVTNWEETIVVVIVVVVVRYSLEVYRLSIRIHSSELFVLPLFSCPETTIDGFTEQFRRIVTARRSSRQIEVVYDSEVAVWSKPSLRKEINLVSSVASDLQLYRRAFQSANSAINDCRKTHFRQRLQDSRDDPRRRWNVVRELLHSSSRN